MERNLFYLLKVLYIVKIKFFLIGLFKVPEYIYPIMINNYRLR